jgi:hypothetical protein
MHCRSSISRLAAAFVFSSWLVASPAAAQDADPRSDPTPVRLSIGVNGAPLLDHVGFDLQLGYAVWRWEHGEIVTGAQLATHFYVPSRPEQAGVVLDALDTSLRLHGILGHVFTVASRQLRIGTSLFTGPSLRIIESHLRDPAHAIDIDRTHVEPLFELGAMLVVGWRVMDGFGVNVSVAIPLWVSGSDSVIEGWMAAPPYVGASATVYL